MGKPKTYSFKTFEKDLAPGTSILCETNYGLRAGSVVQYFNYDDERAKKATHFVLGVVQEILDSFQKKHDTYMRGRR
jgi:hypothetical protein